MDESMQPQNNEAGQLDAAQQAAVETAETAGAPAETGAQTIDSKLVMGAAARQDMNVESSLVFGAAAGRDMAASDGLLVSSVAGRDLTVTDGASLVTVVGNSAQVTNGGSGLTLTREVTAHGSTLGVVVASNVQMDEGSKVMVNVTPQQAAIFGAALGAVFAVLSWLFRRR